MNITVRVTGQSALLKAIKAVNAKVEANTEQAFDQASASTVVDMQARVPVRTRRLQKSIRQLLKERLKRVVGTDVSYGPHVEFGTYKMKAQSFAFPAFERNRVILLKALKSMRFP